MSRAVRKAFKIKAEEFLSLVGIAQGRERITSGVVEAKLGHVRLRKGLDIASRYGTSTLWGSRSTFRKKLLTAEGPRKKRGRREERAVNADWSLADDDFVSQRCDSSDIICDSFSCHSRPAPLAQLDRASGYEPEGREFESLRAHHSYLKDLLTRAHASTSRSRPAIPLLIHCGTN